MEVAAYNSHGTHIAGTISAMMNNEIGIVGVNPTTKIMAIKGGYTIIGNVSLMLTSNLVKGIDFARHNGAHIINASRGGTKYDPNLSGAIKRFTDTGGIFIAAAGNKNTTTPMYPCNFNINNENIICVAAHDSTNKLAWFSNYGNTVNISAPGVGIYSTTLSGSYDYMQGTSMATPHVVGAFSLLRNYRPELSALEIKQAIFSGADTVTPFAEGGDIAGNKKLNLYKALQLLDTIPPTITSTGIDTSNFCEDGTFTYTFSGEDDLQLTGKAYSFDGGEIRTEINSYTTGAYSITGYLQDRVGNIQEIILAADLYDLPVCDNNVKVMGTYSS